MRRTPPQNKVDRSGTGQSGSSPRVTLRLNQIRGARDEKKGGSNLNFRQSNVSIQGQGSMETSSKMPINVSSANSNTVLSTGNMSSSTDSGDVYEFKSSKEPTPVRGASSSPNPNLDKDKDGSGKSSTVQGSQNSGNNVSTTGSSSTPVNEATMVSLTSTDEVSAVSTSSPSAKRIFEGDNLEEQDEENRRKKRKDSEGAKENTKNNPTGRQSTGRNSTSSEKCIKSTKQGSGMASGKGNQNTNSNTDRKSPSASSMATSPKPSNTSSSTSTKNGTPAPLESDSEEDRLKCLDSNSAPKVPPLKIVIPQSTASEQEQGNRNGKNVASRSHQLPYVVASSNSDSTEKDPSQSTSGTTSPTESNISIKGEDKKDFNVTLHGEERSTHHQRVLRSSHRTGNGNNGSTAPKEAVSSSGNGSYTTSSPLPANTIIDRSNNSSPQQRHHSPTPEIIGSDVNKTSSSESTNTGTVSKCNIAVEKSDKNIEATGKNQKDSSMENLENISVTTSSAMSNSGIPAPPVELHPRKRKMKPSKEAQQAAATAAANEATEATSTGPEIHPHDQPITNCYQLFLNIRKQIERRRKGLFPVQPKPPQGFKDYLMNRCTYVLAGNAKEPNVNPPVGLHGAMKDLYIEQEKERYRLRMQHVVEKEKLVLSVEQEILRVHGRAARALANQSLPFSVCTILKDEEVYNVITPEQEEKDRNARSRYNGRLFLSWLQDVDDKWEKIKEGMLLRHHNEAESLHAVQRMHWEWKLKEVGLCESKTTPQIEDIHVPMVHVSDDFDLLPA
ncbi:PREDICTED: serine-rich adhesin for platelets [Cyphomyrmex costatus]|uniref:serine-rich adhesin for platelets n=1 Tax=Cyphomyrmex costatus TaxID=456900 RepID=UPI0008523966|nr:PREDICTED: serine-rich adhesin for platelets [Cyphomyrmex costatus]XP_018404452.1 PREDICTED: serine-rich adhesin for platelets [Cyphomyrmex costatus]XP_018404453.1 PREDICTED: serine-rich adhesin for platelets [Cyphomyrmex costatus]XP_018404454.1 PREDICTED: serine-rich adhesin for platelets [Cyphomyrmex costatus]XP_018404456.1 PREDICTED: serine-rich adhesin for platelets [Cyphomyrmex costatus]